jgi:hypothetical protein
MYNNCLEGLVVSTVIMKGGCGCGGGGVSRYLSLFFLDKK